MKPITSDSNPRFRQWLKLATQPRAVRQMGQTLAEGFHLAQAAFDAQVQPVAVLVRHGANVQTLQPVLERTSATVYELSAALYDALAPVERGVGLMLVLPVTSTELPQRADSDFVYLDGVQDPGNAGALLRVAAAAGIKHICASPATTALWAPKVLRGAQGAHFALQLSEHVTPEQLGSVQSIVWVATVAHQAPSLWNVPLPATSVGWMFGSEGQGLSSEAQALCTLRITVPTSTAVESLNVATCAAVCLFERKRRCETAPR